MKTKRSAVITLPSIIPALLILSVPLVALADDQPDRHYFGTTSMKTNGWDFTFTPYVFVPATFDFQTI